jgi:hypothetical protein
VVGLLQVFPDATVVIDLTVDGENDGLVGVGQRLGARLCGKGSVPGVILSEGPKAGVVRTNTDDAQTLMAKDCDSVS